MKKINLIVKKTFIFLIFALLVFSLCSCKGTNTDKENPDTTKADITTVEAIDGKEEPTEKYNVLLWENVDATLWATNEEAKKGGTNELLMLKTEEKEIHFNGTYNSYVYSSSATRYYNTDVTGDGVKDNIIILISASGTGIHEEKIHIFDGETDREIPVSDSIEYLSTIGITLSADEENYYVTFAAHTETFAKSSFNYYYERDMLLDIPNLDCQIFSYRVEETEKGKSRIYIDNNVSIGKGNVESLGDFSVVYSYCGDSFECEDFRFVPDEIFFYEPQLLEGLEGAQSLIPEIPKAVTAFIRKDIEALEEFLGCREGVLEKYADFEFGKYSFEVGERELNLTVEITESSLPDVQPGKYTVTFSKGRWGAVYIDGLGSYSYEDVRESFDSEPSRYIYNWILPTGLWDFSYVKDINEFKIHSYNSYKTDLVMFLSIYKKDMDTVEDYKRAAKDIFGIEDLDIPEILIEEDGTVIDSYGHGGSVRSYKKIEERVDPDTKITTIYVQTYADFAGTVRSHVYEYKFKDCGDYYKVIYSGIFEKGEYEPEARYMG